MSERSVVLLIGPDFGKQRELDRELFGRGLDSHVLPGSQEGLSAALLQQYAAIVSEIELPGMTGLDLLALLRKAKPNLPVILITSSGTSHGAIEAARLGACDYVVRPIEPRDLADLIAKAASSQSTVSPINPPLESSTGPGGLVGLSPPMQKVYKDIGLAAESSFRVLIRGATGTGKELVARAIHGYSERADKAFVPVNCSAIPESLFESELFGHEPGAFTGAQARRIGPFERAHLGTLFLDEIGELNSLMQVKLLRLLGENQVQRLGGNHLIEIDARIVAATNCDLESAMRHKRFREDLFYRLTLFTIWIPPLSHRLQDIPDLVRHFLHKHQPPGKPAFIEEDALLFLQKQLWPGNVRQLENVTCHAMLIRRSEVILVTDVMNAYLAAQRPQRLGNRTVAGFLEDLLSRAEGGLISDAYQQMIDAMDEQFFALAIRRAKGNQAEVARWFGASRRTVREKLQKFKIEFAESPMDIQQEKRLPPVDNEDRPRDEARDNM